MKNFEIKPVISGETRTGIPGETPIDGTSDGFEAIQREDDMRRQEEELRFRAIQREDDMRRQDQELRFEAIERGSGMENNIKLLMTEERQLILENEKPLSKYYNTKRESLCPLCGALHEGNHYCLQK